MNILYLTNGFPEKNSLGNGVFNYHRYKGLKKLGHNVTVCKLNHLRAHSAKKAYSLDFMGEPNSKVEVINYYQLPKVNIFFKLLPKLKKLVSDYNIDIVHVHFATQAFAAYFLKKSIGIPYVVTAHGSGVERNMTNSARYARITKKALSFADHVIYVSEDLKRVAHKNGLSNCHETVIYNGVESIETDLGVKKDSTDIKKIIYVGSFRDRKRAHFLPDIFREVKKKIPEAQFTIIGDGANKQLIKNKIKEYKLYDSTFLSEGHIAQKEVFSYLKSSDLLLLPSAYEAFGCSLIEAMMCGCQVVVSNNGGMPEVVGDVGGIVDDGEDWIERFSEEIISRLLNPIDINKLTSRAKLFSWEKTVTQEEEVYQKVLNG